MTEARKAEAPARSGQATADGFGSLYRVVPPGNPNNGILYVDHQKNGRSGHGGNALTECANGDILSFYSNVSGGEDNLNGHGTAGWSEYRRSTDGGRTWGDPVVLDYSKAVWDGDSVFSALVFAVTTAPDGTLVAFVIRFKNERWGKQLPPVYLLSPDHGHTWSEPFDLDASATVDDVSLTFDACLVQGDTLLVLFMGGEADYCPGPYTLYASTDNGRSFHRRSTLPFAQTDYYGTLGTLPDGCLIAYSYPFRAGETDEHNMPYAISSDQGRTWSDVQTAHFAKRIRNPQLSERVGELYFMHGRTGSYGDAKDNFVLYASRDAIHWDEGVLLQKTPRPGGDKYSANAVIGKQGPAGRRRLLIQSSILYGPAGQRVNEHHWWIEQNQQIKGEAT